MHSSNSSKSGSDIDEADDKARGRCSNLCEKRLSCGPSKWLRGPWSRMCLGWNQDQQESPYTNRDLLYSLNYTFDLLEHSIDLAVDTGINIIAVLGDFNEDQLKPQNNNMSNIFVKYKIVFHINCYTSP
jgi:hypothetical protein